MNNLILHLLSNRPGPFLEPLFGSNPAFVPTVVPAAEQTLRSLMFLDRTETDYYLKVYLAVLNAYPDWKQQFGYNLQESYQPEEIMPKGVYIEGGDLATFAGSASAYTDLPVDTLPVGLHYQITWVSNTACQVTELETSFLALADVVPSGTDPNKVLGIIWPTGVPFTGPLTLNQEWGEGAVVDIFVQPSNFPFPQLVTNISGNAYLQELLLSYGLSSAFNEDMDAMEQTAMALTMLGLTNQARLAAIRQSQQFSVSANQQNWLTAIPL